MGFLIYRVMEEIWKDIDGYNGNYQVSDKGFVRGRLKPTSSGTVISDKWSILEESLQYGKHPKVSLIDMSKPIKRKEYNDNAHQRKQYYVSRLVLSAFVGDPPTEKHQAIHLDGKPNNVELKNLRWGTRADLLKIMENNGAIAKGELLPQAVICDQEALEIKHLLCNTPYSLKEIAEMYGVNYVVVQQIYLGTTWNHIEWPGKIIKKVYKDCRCCGKRFMTDRFNKHGRPMVYCNDKCRGRYNYLKNSNQKYEDVYG